MRYKHRGTETLIADTEILQEKAQLTRRLVEHFAIIAASPDGEDSSGRQQCRMMTETEVVERAFKIADLTWAKFREQDLIMDVPAPPEVSDESSTTSHFSQTA